MATNRSRAKKEKEQQTTSCHECRRRSKIAILALFIVPSKGALVLNAENVDARPTARSASRAALQSGRCHMRDQLTRWYYYAYPVNHEGACTDARKSRHRFNSECIEKGVLTGGYVKWTKQA